MPITLADATRIAPSDVLVDESDPALEAWRKKTQIEGSSQFARGWETAGLSGQANSLYTQALKAERDGDEVTKQALLQQAQDLDSQAQAWAPTVQNVTDVTGLRSAMDWAGGAMGNLRTSVAPAIGGLVGAAAGSLAGPAGAAAGGFAGASLAGYDMETDEAVAAAMRDPYIRANHTPEEILAASRVKGGINAMLEAAVPAVMGGKILGKGAKAAVGAGWKGAAGAVGKEVATGASGEFATEGAQSLVGQGTQNYLHDQGVTDNLDWTQALNEGAAGAIAGGGMGIVGGGADVLHARIGQGVDKVKEIKKNPAQFAADTVADLGGKAGSGIAALVSGAENIFDRMTDSKRRMHADLINPNIGDTEVEGFAPQWAAHVLDNKKQFSEEDAIAAAKYIQNVGNPGALSIYRLTIEANHNEKKQNDKDAAISADIARRTTGSKSSKMRGTLVDDFGEQEGRDPSEDVLMDDFGNQVSGAMVKHGYRKSKIGDIGFESPNPAPAKAPVEYGQELARRGQSEWPAPTETPAKTREDLLAQQSASRVKQENAAAAKPKTNFVADIWRKQGVSEKLLSATTDKTDENQRQMAISVMGWIERGFEDSDGNVFVPEDLVKGYGKKTEKIITSAVKTAFAHELIGHGEAQRLHDVLVMAKEQHDEAERVFKTVTEALPDYSRNMYGMDDVLDVIIPMLRHVAKHGLSSDKAQAQRQDAALLKIFGTKENIAKAMSKFETPKGRNMLAQENNEDDLRDATTGDIRRQKSSDDNVESDANFESLLTTKTPGDSRVVGQGKENTPFDLQDKDQRTAHNKVLTDGSGSKESVGVVTHLRDTFGQGGKLVHEGEDPQKTAEVLTNAENDILDTYAESFYNRSEYELRYRDQKTPSEVTDKMSVLRRNAVLRKIDARFKLVRIDSFDDSAAPDAIPAGRTSDLRETWGMDNVRSTIAEGGLFLERKRADGSIMKDPFKTSTTKLLGHFRQSKEYDLLSGDGVTQTYQMILKSLAALMETEGAHKLATKEEYERLAADPDTRPEDLAEAKKVFDKAAQGGQFSGRVGYKTEVDGPIKWMTFEQGGWQKDGTWHNAKFDNLPDEFKLDLKSYLKHAKAQADRALRTGDKPGERVPLATTIPEMEKAIVALRDNPTTSEAFANWIDNYVLAAPKFKDGMSEDQRKKAQLKRDADLSDFYVKQRSWEDGQDDLFSRLSDTTSPKRGTMVESQGSAGLLNWLLRTAPEGVDIAAERAASDQTIVSTKDGRQPPGRVVKIPASILEKIAKLRAKNKMAKAKELEDKWTSTFRDVAQWQIANTKDRGSEDDGISIGDLTSDESSMSMTRAEDPSMDGKKVSSTPYIPTFPRAYRDLLILKKQVADEARPELEAAVAAAQKNLAAAKKSGVTEDQMKLLKQAVVDAGDNPEALALAEKDLAVAKASAAQKLKFEKALSDAKREASKIDLSEREETVLEILNKGAVSWNARFGTATQTVGTIHRDEEGNAKGMWAGAEGAAYGGGRSTNTGAKPVAWRQKGTQPYGTIAAYRAALRDKVRAGVTLTAGEERDIDRMRKGENPLFLPEEFQTAGKQNPSGVSAAASEPISAPLATAETPERAGSKIDPILEARDWAFGVLRKGVPAFKAAVKAFPASREGALIVLLKKLQKGVFALSKMKPANIIDELDRSLTEQQAASIISRASTANDILSASISGEALNGNEEHVVGDGRGATGVGSQAPNRGQGGSVLEGSERGAVGKDSGAGRSAAAGNSGAGAQGKAVTGSKQSRMNAGENNGNEQRDDGSNGEPEGRGNTDDGGLSGIDGSLAEKHKTAFARRVAKVSEQLRLSKATDTISHEGRLSAFDGYTTFAAFSQEAEAFIMFVLPTESVVELENFKADARKKGITLGGKLLHRLYGYLSVVRLGYGTDESLTVLAADPGSFGENLLKQKGVLGRTTDRTGRDLNRMEGVTFSQNINLIGEFSARLKVLNGGEEVTINWDRFTGANTDKIGESSFSSQTANSGTGRVVYTPEQLADVRDSITDKLGDSVKVIFVDHFGDNFSGKWTPGATQNLITLALNGDIMSTAAHESLHEFFSQLGKVGSVKTQALLTRVATNPVMLRKLERHLDGHPEAIKQIMTDPEEAAAFMYQFWNAGVLKLGPETQTLFQKVKAFFAKLLHKVSKDVLDEQEAEKLFQAFNDGALADDTTREAVLKAFEVNTEAHNKALDALDKYGREMVRTLGKFGFSAEAMLLATKNKSITRIMRHFNQEAGTAMGAETGKQSYFDGYKQQMGIFMNRLENILTDKAYKPEDLELARKALATETQPTDRVAKQIVARIAKLNEELFHYVTSRNVVRWDQEKHDWVPVEHRKNYFPRVWNTDAIRDDTAKFRELLIKRYMKELTATAAMANQEILEERRLSKGHESRTQLDSGDPETVSPEMIADTIITRLVRGGHADLDETTSSLGMSPAATSVNRRSLSWIDDDLFDEFKSHDMTEIMTSYVSSMVKRAEYTKHFGPGGETLRQEFDRALLEEMGGEALIKRAETEYKDLVKLWEARRAAAIKLGKKFTTPKPTLRRAGVAIHDVMLREKAGKDVERSDESVAAAQADLNKALKSLEQAARGIMGMEGTLGADVSNGVRAVNSALMTYQTIRLLPMVLFSSINDVMGIVANGGELSDAWKALVRGMREVRLRWKDDKSTDVRAQRAEAWGTVEAGSFMDSLGQTYGSMYMTGSAKKMSDSFFKWTGMEGWNRAMRIEATAVAERALRGLQRVGFDKTDKAAVARWEALYGQGMEPSQISLDADGNLDLNNAKNQAAMMRYVNNAIMTPNAAHRTIWGSDTRLAAFWHLKQFSYTFHRVMLKGAMEQAKLGNFRPAMVLALGYAPVTIAAGAVKEMLIPGDEPPWMKGGLGDYLSYGVSRAGIFGVPGMTWSSVSDDYGVNLLGPTVSQVASVPFDNPVKTGLRALPAGSLLGRMAPATP